MNRCNGRVWYFDVPRRTGRTSRGCAPGFEREWKWRQCRKFTMDENGFCRQHQPKADCAPGHTRNAQEERRGTPGT